MEENITINDNKSLKEGYGTLMNPKEKENQFKSNPSEYMKSFIYGGMDGIISIFVALGVASLTNPTNPKIILVLAIAKLIAGR